MPEQETKPGKSQRVYFRITVKIPARIQMSAGKFYDVILNDLSSIGLSFNIEKNINLPKIFKMQFRIPGKFKTTECTVQPMNKLDSDSMYRIGCQIISISKEDSKKIYDYIIHITEFGPLKIFLNIITFLFLSDSLLKLLLFTAVSYYAGILSAQTGFFYRNIYPLFLAGYIFSCTISYFYNCNIKKNRFILGFVFTVLMVGFAGTRYLSYVRMKLWCVDFPYALKYFMLQSLLMAFGLTAIWLYAIHLKKLSKISKTIMDFQQRF